MHGCIFYALAEKSRVTVFSKLNRMAACFFTSLPKYSEGTVIEKLEEILRRIEKESSSIAPSILSSLEGLFLTSTYHHDLDPKVLAAMAAIQQRFGSLAITKLRKKDDFIVFLSRH